MMMPKPASNLPDTEVQPTPALERRTRRVFSPEYKLRILAEADGCARGELGALLRREKLYSAQLQQWRRELAEQGMEGLSKSTPGPKAAKTPEQRRIEQLEKENVRLRRKLELANDCLVLQKKSLVDARTHDGWERAMRAVLHDRPERLPLTQACSALGLNRSTVYARGRRTDAPRAAGTSRKGTYQPRALRPEERRQVLAILHSETYCDQPPAAVYQSLLQQGQYLCSVSTMHRILRTSQQNGERRPQRPAQHHAIPRLSAKAPNEVWTWDITKLSGVNYLVRSATIILSG
jgi:transposase